jgi:hypothetical protein
VQNEGRYKYSPHFFYRRNLAPQVKDRGGSLYGNIRMDVFKRYAEGRTLGQHSNEEGGRDKYSGCPAVFKEVQYSQNENSWPWKFSRDYFGKTEPQKPCTMIIASMANTKVTRIALSQLVLILAEIYATE